MILQLENRIIKIELWHILIVNMLTKRSKVLFKKKHSQRKMWHIHRAYVINQTRTGPRPWEWTLKSGPYIDLISNFTVWVKKFFLRNSRVLILIMTKVISNSSPKTRKSGVFDPKLKDIYFCIKLCSKTNSRTLISIIAVVFQNCHPKHSFKTFMVPSLRILVFVSSVSVRQIWGRWFHIWKWFFRTPARKYPNKAVFVLIVSIFYFWIKPRILKNSRVLISKIATFIKKF